MQASETIKLNEIIAIVDKIILDLFQKMNKFVLMLVHYNLKLFQNQLNLTLVTKNYSNILNALNNLQENIRNLNQSFGGYSKQKQTIEAIEFWMGQLSDLIQNGQPNSISLRLNWIELLFIDQEIETLQNKTTIDRRISNALTNEIAFILWNTYFSQLVSITKTQFLSQLKRWLEQQFPHIRINNDIISKLSEELASPSGDIVEPQNVNMLVIMFWNSMYYNTLDNQFSQSFNSQFSLANYEEIQKSQQKLSQRFSNESQQKLSENFPKIKPQSHYSPFPQQIHFLQNQVISQEFKQQILKLKIIKLSNTEQNFQLGQVFTISPDGLFNEGTHIYQSLDQFKIKVGREVPDQQQMNDISFSSASREVSRQQFEIDYLLNSSNFAIVCLTQQNYTFLKVQNVMLPLSEDCIIKIADKHIFVVKQIEEEYKTQNGSYIVKNKFYEQNIVNRLNTKMEYYLKSHQIIQGITQEQQSMRWDINAPRDIIKEQQNNLDQQFMNQYQEQQGIKVASKLVISCLNSFNRQLQDQIFFQMLLRIGHQFVFDTKLTQKKIFTLGGNYSNDIILENDPEISQIHCQFIWNSDNQHGWSIVENFPGTIQDEPSQNGTYLALKTQQQINEQNLHVSHPWTLKTGMVICLERTQFEVQIQ